MENKRVSELTTASSITADDLLSFSQSAGGGLYESKGITLANFLKFSNLSDTPANLSSGAGKVLAINGAGTTIEYSTANLAAIETAASQSHAHTTYAQETEPSLAADNDWAFWKNTSDSNRIYLVFRRGTADQVKIELT